MALQQSQLRALTHSANWLQYFPPSVKSLQESTLFVKQLTAMTISCITYMRSIFPEHAYRSAEIDDVKLKVLTGSYDCRDAYVMTRWVKSAFSALDKKYMRQLILEILSIENKPLEYYAITYKYNKNGTSCSLSANSNELDFDPTQLENATRKMIHTLLTTTEELESLPKEYRLQLRINYYDEVTPSEFKPKFFKHCKPWDLEKLGTLVHKEIGAVETPHHGFSIHSKSRLFSLEDAKQKFLRFMEIENSSNVVEETEPTVESQIELFPITQDLQETFSGEKTSDLAKVNSTSEIDGENTQETQIACTSQPKLNCICNLEITTNEQFQNTAGTFKCVHCESLHHMVCYGKVDGEEIENGCCYNCANLLSNVACTDPALGKCRRRKAAHVSAYRRLLTHLQSLETLSLKTLKDFIVSTELAKTMITRLKKEKLIEPQKKSRGVFTINRKKIIPYIKQ